MASIARDAKKRRIPFMVVLEPTWTDPGKQLFYKELSDEKLFEFLKDSRFVESRVYFMVLSFLLYNKNFELKSENPEVIVVDPIERFLEEEKKSPHDPVFFDYIHLTPKGNTILANLIANELIQHLSK